MASPTLDDLKRQVESTVTVIDSATTMIMGIADRVQTARDEAVANGATAEELKPINDLVIALKKETDELAEAISANTPAA